MKVKKQGKRNTPNKNKSSKEEKVNCFELKINKKKHSVLGQRSRHDRGNPGISRNKVNKQRLELLQNSTRRLGKSNSFIDKRIGQYDDSLSKEDLIIARMTQARQKKYKKNIYNLNDEEDTHFRKALLGLDNPAKPLSDSDDDEESQLGADFVNEMHFGGFLTKKSDNDKSRREILDDIIQDSKRKKAEKKAEKEETDDLTEELDKEWKEMQFLVSSLRRNDGEVMKTKSDSYDVAVRELRYEPVASAATLKTEEQLQKEEAKKMRRMEQERIDRMNADPVESKSKVVEMSADSIYDGLEIEKDFNDQDLTQVHSHDDDDYDEFCDSNDTPLNDGEEKDLINYLLLGKDKGMVSDMIEMHIQKLASKPYTIESFSELVKDKSVEEVSKLLESIIKENHPGLREGNKVILEDLFSIFLNYVCDHAKDFDTVKLLDAFVPHLYGLSEISPLNNANKFQQVLIERYTAYFENKSYSTITAVLILLKLVSVLYSTSDFRHPIVTPAFLVMSNILSMPYKTTAYNILVRLFISGLFYEYVAFSKRVAPEPINFLKETLSKIISLPHVHGRKGAAKKRDFLLTHSLVKDEPEPIDFNIFPRSDNLILTDNLKISIIYTTVKQIDKFSRLYSNETTFPELFLTAAELCEYLPIETYPSKLVTAIKEFKNFIQGNVTTSKRTHLKFPNKRPPMLKLLEPNFEMNGYSNKTKVTLATKFKREKEFSQKIKKEGKGIIREIRRDAQFLAREHLKQRIEADTERKMKVKKLYQDLAVQQGECKKFSRKK